MNDSEQAIETVLSGLQNADAPPGMERRILTALQDQAPAQPLSVWRRINPLWLAFHAHKAAILVTACSAAGVLVFSLYFPAFHHTDRTLAPSQNSPAYVQPRPSTATQETFQAAGLSASTFIARPAKNSHPRRAPAIDAEASLAEREMHAASLPEPPMPPTEQEKLLLRIVHSNDPVELAELDSTAWAERIATEKADFQRFFEPKQSAATGDNK